MVKLASALSRLNPVRIALIGDLFLDAYTIGKARRISPEAPVAIVHVHEERHQPGGAGNVILNLLSLGATVIGIGRIGNDWAGACLKEDLRKECGTLPHLFIQENYYTPIKNRIIADHQQIVRVDHEKVIPLSEELETQIIKILPDLLKDIELIAISDYGKGFLTLKLLQAIISFGKENKIPVITDPKGSDFSRYHGTTLIKPNQGEAYSAANLPFSAPIEEVAARVLKITAADLVMITRSESGISIFDSKGSHDNFPVIIKEIKDVTGAGDTVLAMLACALANHLSYKEAAQLCNVAAGIAIEQVGCARVTLSHLAHRLIHQHTEQKIFDEEHLFVLMQVLKESPFQLLVISKNRKPFSFDLLKIFKKLAENHLPLLIYVEAFQEYDATISLFASIKEVDFIVSTYESLLKIHSVATPKLSYLLEDELLQPYSIDLLNVTSHSEQDQKEKLALISL